MEQLTKKEEEIMQVLWHLKKGFVKDVIAQMPEPKPPYNTISSVVRILEKKGFIGHKAYGKTHEYFPVISKLAYKKYSLTSIIKNYFEGSYKNVVSFLVSETDLSKDDVNEMIKLIDDKDTSNENR